MPQPYKCPGCQGSDLVLGDSEVVICPNCNKYAPNVTYNQLGKFVATFKSSTDAVEFVRQSGIGRKSAQRIVEGQRGQDGLFYVPCYIMHWGE